MSDGLKRDPRFMIHIHHASTDTAKDKMGQVHGGRIILTGWLHILRLTAADVTKQYVQDNYNILAFLYPDIKSELEINETTYYLPILEMEDRMKHPGLRGLLIQQISTPENEFRTFRRIGTFDSDGEYGVNRFRRQTYDPDVALQPKASVPGDVSHEDRPESSIRNEIHSNDALERFEAEWSEETIILI